MSTAMINKIKQAAVVSNANPANPFDTVCGLILAYVNNIMNLFSLCWFSSSFISDLVLPSLKWEPSFHNEKCPQSNILHSTLRTNYCRIAHWAFKNHWTSCQIELLLSRERGLCVGMCECVCPLICGREVAGLCVRMIRLPSLTLKAEKSDEYDP